LKCGVIGEDTSTLVLVGVLSCGGEGRGGGRRSHVRNHNDTQTNHSKLQYSERWRRNLQTTKRKANHCRARARHDKQTSTKSKKAATENPVKTEQIRVQRQHKNRWNIKRRLRSKLSTFITVHQEWKWTNLQSRNLHNVSDQSQARLISSLRCGSILDQLLNKSKHCEKRNWSIQWRLTKQNPVRTVKLKNDGWIHLLLNTVCICQENSRM